MTIALLITLAAAIIIVGPIATIWALNTIFLLSIPFTFKTWLAMVVIGMFISGVKVNKK